MHFQGHIQRLLCCALLLFTTACKSPLQKQIDEMVDQAEKTLNRPEFQEQVKKEAQEQQERLRKQAEEAEEIDKRNKKLAEQEEAEKQKEIERKKNELPLQSKDGYKILEEGIETFTETRDEFTLDKSAYQLILYRIHSDKSKIKIVSFQEDASQYKNLKQLREELNAKLVINGGFFADSKNPHLADGLLMLDGKKISDINPKLSGVFTIQENLPSIIETNLFKINSDLKADISAIQGTPRLVDRGGVIGIVKPDLTTTKDQRRMRTAVCTLKNNDLLLMITMDGYKGLYLYELALIAKAHGCEIALNLDGGPASSISVKRFERQVDGKFTSHELNIPAQNGWVHPNVIVIE